MGRYDLKKLDRDENDRFFLNLGLMVMLKEALENMGCIEDKKYLLSLKDKALEEFRDEYDPEYYDMLEKAVEE